MSIPVATTAKRSSTASRAAAARQKSAQQETAQAKSVALGRPGDRYEREADAVAEQVVSGQPARTISSLPSGGLAQSKEEDRETAQAMEEEEPAQAMEEEEPAQAMEEEPLQEKATVAIRRERKKAAASRAIHERGAGTPLPPATREALEESLGADLSDVRVHIDAVSRQAAREMGARAFTHRNQVFLGPGESPSDLRLMAHEVAHVVQQGGASRREAPSAGTDGAAVQSQEAAPETEGTAAEVAPDVIDLKGMAKLQVPEQTVEWLKAREKPKRRTGLVRVRFGSVAEGQILMEGVGQKTVEIPKRQSIPLRHELFARLGDVAPDLQPSLILNPTTGGNVTGFVGLQAQAKIPSSSDLQRKLGDLPGLVSLPGFEIGKLSKLKNKLSQGALEVGVTDAGLSLGKIFQGTLSFTADDQRVTSFEGRMAVRAEGLAEGELQVARDQEGLVTGQADVDLALPANFSGKMTVVWDGQAVSGTGQVGYQGEKLSGTVTLNLMEKEAAQKLEDELKPPPEAEVKPKKQKKGKKDEGKYVVFGEGDLTFAFNDWLNGTAHVIVDPKGFVTILGKITPQKEFELFPQKDYNKELFDVEARATYGLPVVGNIFIFANVSLSAFAKVGPAKLYQIEVDGTYSTDPEKSQSFTIRGTLNLSAAAGLNLRAEAGAGLEILSHDIKAGAGINGLAGIRGYAEATPIIGYREEPAAEGVDKKGEFFIRGDVEIAAQPFLGLSGDLFVELDSPWWSPAPDKKWTWPLGSKEWPIGGDFGIGASVDYVFGSGKLPTVEMKKVDFSADKFITDLYNDEAKSKSERGDQQGTWKEKNQKAAQPPPKEAPAGDLAPGKAAEKPPAKSKVEPGGKKKKKKGKKDVDPKTKTADGKTVAEHQKEATEKTDLEDPKAKREQGVAVAPWWGLREEFTADDKEKHELYFRGTGPDARLMVASKNPKLYEDFLKGVVTADDTKDKALVKAREVDAKRQEKTGDDEAKIEKKKEELEKLLVSLRALTKSLFGALRPSSPAGYHPDFQGQVGGGEGFSRSGHIKPLTILPPATGEKGSKPTPVAHQVYDQLNRRRSDPAGKNPYYIRGHLINHNLHGPGEWTNMTPLSKKGNSGHEGQVESKVKAAVRSGATVQYTVIPKYPSGGRPDKASLLREIEAKDSGPIREKKTAIVEAEDFVPLSLRCAAYTLDQDLQRNPGLGLSLNVDVVNELDRGYDDYHVDATTVDPEKVYDGLRRKLRQAIGLHPTGLWGKVTEGLNLESQLKSAGLNVDEKIERLKEVHNPLYPLDATYMWSLQLIAKQFDPVDARRLAPAIGLSEETAIHHVQTLAQNGYLYVNPGQDGKARADVSYRLTTRGLLTVGNINTRGTS